MMVWHVEESWANDGEVMSQVYKDMCGGALSKSKMVDEVGGFELDACEMECNLQYNKYNNKYINK